jgi:malonate transporter and related proteins
LVSIGFSLTRYQLKTEISESLMISALSLIVHPLVAFVLAEYVLGLSPEYVRVAVLLAAMPPGMNVYIFATMYERAVALAASSVLIATTLSVATITVWLYILHTVLPA